MGKKDKKIKSAAGLTLIGDGRAKCTFEVALDSAVVETMEIKLAAKPGEDLYKLAGVSADEYFVKRFRLLSLAMTPYRFFDFTTPGVLETATPLFEGVTVYADHYSSVDYWKGFVRGVYWDADNNPAGVNGLVCLDKTIDAKLARGVETGALRSGSVTIFFEFERSHPELSRFWDYLGEDVDGEIVRLIVTKITRSSEFSIVWEGEDPNAKALSLQAGDENNKRDEEESMKIKLGLPDKQLSALGLTAEIENSELDGKLLTVAEKLESLEKGTTQLRADAEIGKKHLAGLRERAETLYQHVKGDAAVDSFVNNVIKKADMETAEGLVEEFSAAAEKSAPLVCADCGGKMSRRSSSSGGAGGDDGKTKNVADFKIKKST